MIFIPLFIFLIKMIITVGKIETRLDSLCQKITDVKSQTGDVVEMQSDIRILKLRTDNMEEEVHDLRRGYNVKKSGRPFQNYDDERKRIGEDNNNSNGNN